jgi:peptidoglycan-associated lipoprotein
MLNKKNVAAYAVVALAVALAGCSGSGETKPEGPTTPATSAPSYTPPANTNTGPTGPVVPSEKSVYFDFDKSEIKPEGFAVISSWAQYLSANPTAKVRLEGNTDERGTREYNIGLGERRANAVGSALQAKGVSASQLSTVSYGKERPVALGHDEASWAQNRRVDIVGQ